MIRCFLCGLLLVGLISCSARNELPDAVLPADKMESILWDLIRAEQFVSNYVVGHDTSRSARAQGPMIYEAILKKYGTSDSLFQRSLTYYKEHPKLLFPILDSLGLRPDLAPTPLAVDTASESNDVLQKPLAY